MEIINETEKAFNSYFRLFKKQPTKNPESNMHMLNLIIDTLALPSHLDDNYKQELFNNWNSLKHLWVNCTIQPTEDGFNLIESSFNTIINLYRTNNVIIDWYENVYKQNLLETNHHFEDSRYTYTIKNLQHQTTAYDYYVSNHF